MPSVPGHPERPAQRVRRPRASTLPTSTARAARSIVLDCSTIGGCDSGAHRPTGSTCRPAATRRSTEECLRLVVGHELFHHIQYEAIGHTTGRPGAPTRSRAPLGSCRTSSTSDLDNNAGCITYLSQVNNYLGDPSRTLWGLSYTTALFWNYLMERSATTASSPGSAPTSSVSSGRTPRTPAPTATSSARSGSTIRRLRHERDAGRSLPRLHRRQLHEADGPQRAYPTPRSTATSTSSRQAPRRTPTSRSPTSAPSRPTSGPSALSVNSWAAKYLQADIGDCTGVAGLVVDGDRAGVALASVGQHRAPSRGSTSPSAPTSPAPILVRTRSAADKRITRLGAVITGLNDARRRRLPLRVRLLPARDQEADRRPTRPSSAPRTHPNRFQVRVQVHGPSELGTPSVEGLRPERLHRRGRHQGRLDHQRRLRPGRVLADRQGTDSFPAAAADVQDLTVHLGDVSASNVSVGELPGPSTSTRCSPSTAPARCSSPAASPKIDAARNAAIDVRRRRPLRRQARCGQLQRQQQRARRGRHSRRPALDDVRRPTAPPPRAKVLGLSAGGMTSIGDGVFTSAAEFPIRGTVLGEDHIVLLSDGMENEGRFWSSVRAAVISAGIKVDTIALGPLTDQALLQQIADDTGGTYYYVDVSSGISARSPPVPPSAARASPTTSPTSTSRPTRTPTTSSASGQGGSTLDLRCQHHQADHPRRGWHDRRRDRCELARVSPTRSRSGSSDPHGNIVSAGGGVEVTTDRHPRGLPDPDDGQGHLAGCRVQNPGKTTGWVAMAAGQPGNGTTMWTSVGDTHVFRKEPDGHRWGERSRSSRVSNDRFGRRLRTVVSWATVTHPDGTTLRLPLLDDGNHGDGSAGRRRVRRRLHPDHRRSRSVAADTTLAKPDGSYQVQIKATGINNVDADYTRLAGRSFALYENGDPHPDIDGDGMPNLYEGYHPCLQAAGPVRRRGTDPDGDGLESLARVGGRHRPVLRRHRPRRRAGRLRAQARRQPLRRHRRRAPASRGCGRRSTSSSTTFHDWRFKPRTLLIRYPANPSYDKIRLLRATAPTGPFTRAMTFDSTAKGGRVRDTGPDQRHDVLLPGRRARLRRQPLRPRARSSAVRRARIRCRPSGRSRSTRAGTYAETTSVQLGLHVDDGDVTEMMVSNDGDFTAASWQPFSSTLDLDPRSRVPPASPPSIAKFRDAAGNESNAVTDEIVVQSGFESLSGVVKVDKLPQDKKPDGIWMWVVGHPELPIVRTDKLRCVHLHRAPGRARPYAGRRPGRRLPHQEEGHPWIPSVVTPVPVITR